MKAISGDLLTWLAEPALRSLTVACVTALLIGLIRPRRAAVRFYTWRAVLCVALAMPLLTAFLPQIKLALPSVPRLFTTRTAAPDPPNAERSPSSFAASAVPGLADAVAPQRHSTTPPLAQTHSDRHPARVQHSEPAANTSASSAAAFLSHMNWRAAAVALYFLGLGVLLVRLFFGISGSHRLVREASHICHKYFPRKNEVEDAATSAALDLLASRSHAAGLKIAPLLKESAALCVPATVGIRRAAILLPAGWHEWPQEKLKAVLGHEISHVARRDALTQLLSSLHRAIFWFSPLPWWLDRQLTEGAEQASDEAALAAGVDRTVYAETLLAFFAQLESVPGRVHWQALSMASRNGAGHAEQRVDRILAWKGAVTMKTSFIVAGVICAVPVIFLAASLRPFVAHAAAQAPPEPPVRAVLPAAPNPPMAVRPAQASPTVKVAQTEPDAKNKNAAEPREQKQPASADTMHMGGGTYYGDSGPRWVFVRANSNNVSMSGDDEDLQHARRLRDKIKGDFIWFERDEKSYVITDPAFLARVSALFAPQEELAKQQEALARQQDELGRQQDALGTQQEKVRVQVPDIRPDLERIRLRLKELQAEGATQRELGSVQSQLGQLQSRIGRFQSEAGQQQSVIGRQQGELGRKQGELGRQQGELGRRQGQLARQATRELRGMFDDAIAKGIAKPE